MISVSFLIKVVLPDCEDFASCSTIFKSIESHGECEFSMFLIWIMWHWIQSRWSANLLKQKWPQTTLALSLLYISNTCELVKWALNYKIHSSSVLTLGALVIVCSCKLNKMRISPCSAILWFCNFGTSNQNSPWVTTWKKAHCPLGKFHSPISSKQSDNNSY